MQLHGMSFSEGCGTKRMPFAASVESYRFSAIPLPQTVRFRYARRPITSAAAFGGLDGR